MTFLMKLVIHGTCIKWIKGSEQHISNNDYFLLNRVLYVPNTLFSNFAKIDRDYAQRELEAYMGFSFNAFTGIGNQLANGACIVSPYPSNGREL